MKPWAIVLFGFCIAAAPATRKAASQPLDAFQARAIELVKSGKLKGIVDEAEKLIPPALANPQKIDGEKLIRGAWFREIGAYFSRIGELDAARKATLTWLIAQPKLAAALLLAATDSDPPDRVLDVLAVLHAQQGDAPADTPELTAAICLVWDAPARFGPDEDAKLDPQRVNRIYSYYAKAVRGAAMPAELLAYVVDSSLSEEETTWTMQHYSGSRGDVPGAFCADVMYNESASFEHDPTKPLDEKSYLMPNIARMGGSCTDQAHFAAQVGKTSGIGTIVCNAIGYGDAKPQAAWTGFLQSASKGWAWNFNAARYPEHDRWPAEMVDPQTMNAVPPADAQVLELLGSTKPLNRQMSAAIFKARPEFDWMLKVIDLSPGNRAAWFALADLSDAQKLTAAQSAQLVEKIRKLLLDAYPDFALRLRLRMLAHRGHDLQLAELGAMAKSFTSRGDLLGQIKLAEADLHIADKQPDAVIKACGDAMRASNFAPAIAYLALARIDSLLRDGQAQRLAGIYAEVFDRLPRLRPSAYVRTTPYDLIGRRYAEILDELKRNSDAQSLRARLDTLHVSASHH